MITAIILPVEVNQKVTEHPLMESGLGCIILDEMKFSYVLHPWAHLMELSLKHDSFLLKEFQEEIEFYILFFHITIINEDRIISIKEYYLSVLYTQ